MLKYKFFRNIPFSLSGPLHELLYGLVIYGYMEIYLPTTFALFHSNNYMINGSPLEMRRTEWNIQSSLATAHFITRQ